jgi:hypothetical protein
MSGVEGQVDLPVAVTLVFTMLYSSDNTKTGGVDRQVPTVGYKNGKSKLRTITIVHRRIIYLL